MREEEKKAIEYCNNKINKWKENRPRNTFIFNGIVDEIKELLEKIILEFGNRIGEDLVILHNEYYEDGICTWNMCKMIEEVFNLNSDENEEDDTYTIYIDLRKDLISYKEVDEAYENLGLEREEEYYE